MDERPTLDLPKIINLLLLCSLPCWITLLVAPASAAAAGVRQAVFYRLSYMDDHVVDTQSGPMEDTLVAQRSRIQSVTECAAACLVEEKCSSFFHDKGGQTCLMHSVVFLAADEAVPQPGTTYWQISQDDCPASDGFYLYRPLGLCYKYYDQTVYWNEAEIACQGAGTSLVKVNDSATSVHLYEFLRGSTATRLQHMSIGATEKSGSWQWRDGSAITWFNWASGEPSDVNERCVTMAWFFYFKWNDVPCDGNPVAKYHYMCQKAL